MKYAQQILTNNLLTEMFLGMLPQHRLGQPDYKFDSHEPGLIHFKDAFQDELDFLSSDDAFKSFYITDFEVLDSNKKPREPYGKLWRQFCTTFLGEDYYTDVCQFVTSKHEKDALANLFARTKDIVANKYPIARSSKILSDFKQKFDKSVDCLKQGGALVEQYEAFLKQFEFPNGSTYIDLLEFEIPEYLKDLFQNYEKDATKLFFEMKTDENGECNFSVSVVKGNTIEMYKYFVDDFQILPRESSIDEMPLCEAWQKYMKRILDDRNYDFAVHLFWAAKREFLIDQQKLLIEKIFETSDFAEKKQALHNAMAPNGEIEHLDILLEGKPRFRM